MLASASFKSECLAGGQEGLLQESLLSLIVLFGARCRRSVWLGAADTAEVTHFMEITNADFSKFVGYCTGDSCGSNVPRCLCFPACESTVGLATYWGQAGTGGSWATYAKNSAARTIMPKRKKQQRSVSRVGGVVDVIIAAAVLARVVPILPMTMGAQLVMETLATQTKQIVAECRSERVRRSVDESIVICLMRWWFVKAMHQEHIAISISGSYTPFDKIFTPIPTSAALSKAF